MADKKHCQLIPGCENPYYQTINGVDCCRWHFHEYRRFSQDVASGREQGALLWDTNERYAHMMRLAETVGLGENQSITAQHELADAITDFALHMSMGYPLPDAWEPDRPWARGPRGWNT